MKLLKEKLATSPAAVRVGPFFIFVILTCLQGSFGEAGQYWVYLAKTLAGAWLIWELRPLISEMRWAISWEAVGVGVVIFGLWVGLETYYPHWEGQASGKSWTPFGEFGQSSAMAWFFISVRVLGTALIVPPIEEVFYRSYFYRTMVSADFQKIPLGHFSWTPFLVTSAIFGLVHPNQWLPGILCGLAYQWLVVRKGRLGDAMTAHAITNFLLGVWIVWRGAWNFW